MTKTAWNWSKAAAIAAVLGVAVTILSCAFGALGSAVNQSQSVIDLERRVGDHETRLRTVEESVHGIAVNVEWLRRDREKERGLKP